MFKILVVDDWEPIFKIYSSCFSKSCKMLFAKTADEAIDCIKIEKPDIVLLDLILADDSDGYSVLDFIRSESDLSQTKVAVISANKGLDHAEAAIIKHGADHYFTKPVPPPDLVRWVFRQLGEITVKNVMGLEK